MKVRVWADDVARALTASPYIDAVLKAVEEHQATIRTVQRHIGVMKAAEEHFVMLRAAENAVRPFLKHQAEIQALVQTANTRPPEPPFIDVRFSRRPVPPLREPMKRKLPRRTIVRHELRRRIGFAPFDE